MVYMEPYSKKGSKRMMPKLCKAAFSIFITVPLTY